MKHGAATPGKRSFHKINRHQPPRPRPTRRRQPPSTPRVLPGYDEVRRQPPSTPLLRLAPGHAHRPPTPPVAAPSPPPPPPLATYPQVKPITLPAAGTVPTLPPLPHPPRSPTAPHLTAPPHRANPTQWRRHIAPTPPRLRCPCTTPLSDRTLRTPPPTPCPIMGHTQASLCDRPCPGSELRSLTPCPPPHPPKGASRSRRGPLPPPLPT